MRELICPGVYKHFKGNSYEVIGVSNRKYWEIVEDYEVDHIRIKCIYAKHTETNERIKIWQAGDKYFHDKELYEDEVLVLYRPLYDSDVALYVRPIESFMSEVDNEKYKDCGQKYRFEFIK